MKDSPSEPWLPPGVTPEEEEKKEGIRDLLRKNAYRKIDPSIEKLGKREVQFLIHYGKALSERIPEVSYFEQFEINECGEVSGRDYLDLELQWFVNIPEALRLRERFSKASRNRQLPPIQYFSERILADNVLFNHPSEQVRLKRAKATREALSEMLGLRKKKKIQQLRDEVIVECQTLGMSQKEICCELDSHQDLLKDPLLEKWAYDVMFDRRLTFFEALVSVKLEGRLKKLISTAEERIT